MPAVDSTFVGAYTENTAFVGEEFQWSLGVCGNWTLWDGGLRVAQGRELASQHRSALLGAERKRRLFEEEIRVSWYRLRGSVEVLAAVDAERALAVESLVLAETSFENGTATWLDVEQARLAVRAAELAAVTERMNRDLAAIDLNVAIGAL